MAAKPIADAAPTPVNSQITDAITDANTKVLGDAPAVALGNLYIATAQALSNAAHNATTAQQNANTILQATTTQGVALLYGIDITESAGVVEAIRDAQAGTAAKSATKKSSSKR